MSLFVCDKCEAIENTAKGWWWCKDTDLLGRPDLSGLALCSECMPDKFRDGSPNRKGGKWHGLWPKRGPTQAEIDEGQFINRGPNA